MKREDGAGYHQVEPFALYHELFAAVSTLSLSNILDASPSPPTSPSVTSGGACLLRVEDEDLARRALGG
jgi:hypothetical protein